MRFEYTLCCCIAVLCVSSQMVEAKTVFRRRDKISENFKQLNLPQEEVDPNVAPPEPQKVETSPAADESANIAAVNDATAEAPIAGESIAEENNADEAGEELDANAAVNEITDDAVNVDPVAVEVTSAAPGSATAVPVAGATTETSTEPSGLSKYCKCSDTHCDCCRHIGLPLLPLRGPGCAKITYLGDEKMSISIRYGDITLATRTVSSKKARPVCVGLPGGYSKFCGRVYGLAKTKDNFKACLGFELRADDEVEAALRVSCFKFGPDGLRVADAEPLPSEVNKEEEDDDDIFGFGAGGDDEDEDDYEDEADEADDDEPEEEYEDDEEGVATVGAEAPEEADYGGFSLAGLLEELADEDEETTSSVVKPAPASPPAIETRTAQGKDDKDIQAHIAEGSGPATDAGDTVSETSTTAPKNKPKKGKGNKAKKNKKKKTAAATESGFAYQILSGILDFFN